MILQNFNAKLSDFGLARDGPEDDQSHVSTRILGARVYFATEYIAAGHLTLKADVYSFGVFLLEILSGSGAVRKHSDGEVGNLAQWAEPFLSNKLELHRVIDKRLGHNFPMERTYELAQLILHCLCLNPEHRPTMAEVVAALEQIELNLGFHHKRTYSRRTRTHSYSHS
ncbi:probable serine/threonine-protein kinase PBL11 [Neltuma alba]|uniref:probable serine/threonine-protein kinase PBL11 n=1 Tax=Neltuma alba TaxID=207710 RepID=UPI0010A5548E|nr:probable serine/threonine-protein kinase PBL11 [Prosopis alba]